MKNRILWDLLYNRDERRATVTLQGSCIKKEKWLGDCWKSGEYVLDNIKSFSNKGSIHKLLDLGCGSNGRFLIPAALNNIKSFGIDHSKPALDKINTRIHNTKTQNMVFLCQADAEKTLPFKNASFDAVLCQGLICHVKNQRELLNEVFRILKPDGVIFFGSFLNILHPAHFIYYFVNRLKAKAGISVTPYYYSTLEDVNNMFEFSGFKIARADKTMSLRLFYDTIRYPSLVLRLLDKIAFFLFRVPFKYEIYARKRKAR